MEDFWARVIQRSGQQSLNYWEYFAERLSQIAIIIEGSRILDIGTYDGNVLIKAMKKMTTSGYGIGVDIYYGGFADGVADVMEQRLGEYISFVQMDAKSLGFPNEKFQTVLANFVGWDNCFDFKRMEFINSDTMMSEIMRVLKPGGQVGIGSWIEQSDIDWIIGAFKKYHSEYDHNFICYAKENSEGQKIILKNSGFEDIQVYVETTNFVSPDAETWWQQMRRAASAYFGQIPDSKTLESFKTQVFSDLQPFHYPEGIRFGKTVSYAFGTKPA